MFSIKVLEKGIFFIRIPRRHWARFRGFVSILIIFVFLLSSVLPSYAQSVLNLPVPGTMVNLSPAFVPVLLKGMTIDSKNPLYFDFIVDSGNTKFTQDQIKEESSRLVKYFLAAMTVPQDEHEFQWILLRTRRKFSHLLLEYGDPLEHIHSYVFQGIDAPSVEVRPNGDFAISPYLPIVFGNFKEISLKEAWDKGLKDAWRHPATKNMAQEINSISDFSKFINPWSERNNLLTY